MSKKSKRELIGSIFLTVIYLLVMACVQYLTRSYYACGYKSDPPTREMILEINVYGSSKGMFWLEWLLPLLLVWAVVFLIWEMKEASVLLSVTGCGFMAALAYHKKAYSFRVNQEEIFKAVENGLEYTIEWKIWALIICAFLLVLPFLKKEAVCNRKKRMFLLGTALLVASGGGIIISITDFGWYSLSVFVRSIVLFLIALLALYSRQTTEEKTEWNFLWTLTGIAIFVLYMAFPSALVPRVQRFPKMYLCFGLLVFLCLILYELCRNKSQMTSQQFRCSCFIIGLLVLYGGMLALFTENKYLISKFGIKIIAVANWITFRGKQFDAQAGYLIFFLTLSWVFYFFRMKNLKILSSIAGIACIWFYLMEVERFSYRSTKMNPVIMVGMIFLLLPSILPYVWPNAQKLPRALFALFIVGWFALNSYVPIIYMFRMKSGIEYVKSYGSFFLFHILLLLIAGFTIAYDVKRRKWEQTE